MTRRFVPKVSIGVAAAFLACAWATSQTITKSRTKTTTVEVKVEKKGGDLIEKVEAPPVAQAPNVRVQLDGAVVLPAIPPAPAAPQAPAPVARVAAANREQQFRSYLRVEYHFLRTVCGLSEEQRKQVARDAERALKEAVAKYNEIQQEMQTNVRFRKPGEPPKVLTLPDPCRLIQECLASAAEAHVSPQQMARYRREVAERAEERKRVAIENVVARLDQELVLSRSQREQLSQALSSGWDESWFPTTIMLLNVDRFISRIPRHLILPLLDEGQRNLWSPTSQGQVATAAVVNPLTPLTMQNDFIEDEELDEARRAEADRTPTPAVSVPGILSR